MQNAFDECIAFTLHRDQDGQPFHVSPGDPGGATSWGLTRETWSRWLQRPATMDDMRAITRESAVPVYRAWYWNPVNGPRLPAGVNLLVFDHGVTSGPHVSAMELQRALGFTGDDVDGWIGPHTLAAVAMQKKMELLVAIADQQEAQYRSCWNFSRFGNGWLARLQRRLDAAIAMAAPNTPATT